MGLIDKTFCCSVAVSATAIAFGSVTNNPKIYGSGVGGLVATLFNKGMARKGWTGNALVAASIAVAAFAAIDFTSKVLPQADAIPEMPRFQNFNATPEQIEDLDKPSPSTTPLDVQEKIKSALSTMIETTDDHWSKTCAPTIRIPMCHFFNVKLPDSSVTCSVMDQHYMNMMTGKTQVDTKFIGDVSDWWSFRERKGVCYDDKGNLFDIGRSFFKKIWTPR